MKNISGIILTKNNARTIKDCVSSLSPLVDELIIIDDFSDDTTIDLVQSIRPDAIIIKQKLERFDEQRNQAIASAKHDWILMIDSDEIITEELAKSIRDLQAENGIDAYWSNRLNRFFDAYLTEKYWNRPILFRKSLHFSFPVHEIIEMKKDRLKQLSGSLKHECWAGIRENMDKMNKYSGLVAQKWIEQNRNYGDSKLFFMSLVLPVRYFFICFFGKKFYKAGLFNGLFYSLFESSWWLAAIFKYREARK